MRADAAVLAGLLAALLAAWGVVEWRVWRRDRAERAWKRFVNRYDEERDW